MGVGIGERITMPKTPTATPRKKTAATVGTLTEWLQTINTRVQVLEGAVHGLSVTVVVLDNSIRRLAKKVLS